MRFTFIGCRAGNLNAYYASAVGQDSGRMEGLMESRQEVRAMNLGSSARDSVRLLQLRYHGECFK